VGYGLRLIESEISAISAGAKAIIARKIKKNRPSAGAAGGHRGALLPVVWHLRGNVSMSPLAAPMPPGLSWSSPTCLCTPEIAVPSPPST
jgi:hypothetical protein